MTNHARGSSLLQARDNLHRRLHSDQLARNPRHADTASGDANHIRSPPSEENKLQGRQVVVVQTVSVVHVIDETGAIIALSTILPDPVPQLPNPPAALTAGLSALDIALPSVTPSVDGLPSDGVGSALPSVSLLPGDGSLTSSPFPSSSTFPSLSPSGGFNSSKDSPPPLPLAGASGPVPAC